MDPFHDSAELGSPTRSHRAQSAAWPAVVALTAVCVSGFLLLPSGRLPLWIIGYTLAAVLAPAFVVLFRVLDRRARQDRVYTRRHAPRRLAALAITLGLVVGATHAWMIATEIAKR